MPDSLIDLGPYLEKDLRIDLRPNLDPDSRIDLRPDSKLDLCQTLG